MKKKTIAELEKELKDMAKERDKLLSQNDNARSQFKSILEFSGYSLPEWNEIFTETIRKCVKNKVREEGERMIASYEENHSRNLFHLLRVNLHDPTLHMDKSKVDTFYGVDPRTGRRNGDMML